MTTFLNYFSLSEPRLVLAKGGGIQTVKQPLYFLAVLLGAFSLVIFNHIRDGAGYHWGSFVTSLIVSVLAFPYVYNHAGLKAARMSFAKWCLAFQYGFFWPAIFEKVQLSIH